VSGHYHATADLPATIPVFPLAGVLLLLALLEGGVRWAWASGTSIGLFAVAAAKRMGASRIILMGRHKRRTDLGREFGATDVVPERGPEGVERVREMTSGDGTQHVIEAVGYLEAYEQALGVVRDGGVISRIGVPQYAEGPVGLHLYRRNVTLTGGVDLPKSTQYIAFALFAVAFAVKAPLWPLHTWLPDAHTQAPTVGSVILAGVLLKMGTYGLIRIGVGVTPLGAAWAAPVLGILAAAAILAGALICLRQTELKRLIAYSSVGHMGFVLLGIATLTVTGVEVVLVNVSSQRP